ncbi:venom factor-like isoform X1 [Phyllobates terribilis]|uniref:venom factor-like isoform X1 n=2 Tax=Phyllobates terribilis TaxID=111132 RepID=UPI003CCB2F90
MEWRVVCLLLLSFVSSIYTCTLITPGILRADTDETIVLDGHNSGFDAEISVQEFPVKKQILAEGRISVNSNNDYLGTMKINIKSRDLLNEPKKRYYVSVKVSSPQCTLEKVVVISFHSGYIFIQTDKTIYTPGSKVLYRIYPLNYKMQSSKQSVIFEIKNPDGIVTVKEQWFPDKSGIISKNYALSDLAWLGTWTMTARYDNSHNEFSAHFEVKEYVLPSFEVIIKPEKSFMYIDDRTFSVTIESRYLFKKPVNGIAFAIFGLKKGDEKRSLTDSLRKIEIEEGIGHVELQRRDLVKSFNNPEDLLQYKLYVSVTVITDEGSDFVEAELDDIYIVNSPYKIIFTRTSKYFKPGMPYDLLVMVTNPDGSPAKNIAVVANPGNERGATQQDGIARLKMNTALNVKSLKITVRTDVPGLPNNLQASAETTADAYRPLNGQDNYLHIGVTNNILEPKTQIYINFNILNSNINIQNQITRFTYLILSKGQIIKAGKYNRQVGQVLVSMPLFITEDFMPSFRIVAYYTVSNQIVPDSLWLDVVDDCTGTLSLKAEKNIAKPQEQIKLTLKADHNAHVGLVAVDKGVFAINSKHKMTQSKVWDTVEKSDIGCSPGSGADNMGVFYDAGLAVQTNFGMTTAERSDPSCKDKKTRKRRSSVALMDIKTQKASNYTNLEKQCCNDGMIKNPMDHSCERRALLIQEGEKCKEAFLDCCRYIDLKLKMERLIKESDLDSDRSENDVDYYPDADILVRSQFPESWLWSIVKMDETPDAENISTKVLSNTYLKDSITTWELLAVSLSENKGICVAKPYEILTFQNFFVDLRLPYSAVRNEQVEIRAIIYNYESKEIRVRVTLSHNPEFCSPSTPRIPYSVVVKVKETSSYVVPFVIVPLTVGQHHVQVKASLYGEFGGDGIKKSLRVVPEGIRKTAIISSVTLDPVARSGEHVIRVPSLENRNIVPDSPTRLIVNVQGIPIAQFVEDAIDGTSLSRFIVTPSGCAEQNMASFTPLVTAANYLDKTNQWDRIGVHRRAEAIQKINTGYVNQIRYRKSDGSFQSFPRTSTGTWFTAYAVKVFSMAKSFVNVQEDILCGSVKWLVLVVQQPDGMFNENIPISYAYSRGGVAGSIDPDVAITAYVVISLLESQKYCSKSVNSLQSSIEKAINYIEDRYQKLKRPYSVAITAYALAIAGRLKDPLKLLSAAKDNFSWGEDGGSKMISIEATSYALLALLKLETNEAIDAVNPVVRWLTEQQSHGQAYGSTQALIMLFQAVAQYQLAKADQKSLEMDISFHLPGRKDVTTYQINMENAIRARSEETNINKEFVVKAKGRGQASLTVMAVYYELLTEAEKECQNFHLSVTVENENVVKPDVLETISLNICFRHRQPVDATMSIIDVSMMTGFSPDERDLKRLKNGVDRYISFFEINKGAFDKGALIIYLDSVSHTEEQCLKFNLHKYLNVGLMQPGSVTIYDYYSPENRCRKFYHSDEGSKVFGRICQDKVCRCAEGNCLMDQSERHSALDRLNAACKSGVDHVFKITLLDFKFEKDFDRYEMQVKEVYKRGTDEKAKGNKRTFISHIRCRENLKLKKGEDYIVLGADKNVWYTEKSGYTYVLGGDTWIEWWPNNRECQEPDYIERCNDFETFADELEIIGCQT